MDSSLRSPISILIVTHSQPDRRATLLHTKRAGAVPRRKQKHFLVKAVIQPLVEGGPVEFVELEAVHSKRLPRLPWRDLMDRTAWVQGWQ